MVKVIVWSVVWDDRDGVECETVCASRDDAMVLGSRMRNDPDRNMRTRDSIGIRRVVVN